MFLQVQSKINAVKFSYVFVRVLHLYHQWKFRTRHMLGQDSYPLILITFSYFSFITVTVEQKNALGLFSTGSFHITCYEIIVCLTVLSLDCSQKDDLKAVVNYLRDDGNVSLIGLWGRSMGAVTR